MSARSQLQSKSVADLRSIADSLGIDHKGLQKAKLIDLLVEHSDEILDAEEIEVAEVISKSMSFAFCKPLCSMPKLSAIERRSATGFDCNCDLADTFSPIVKF